MFWGEGWAFLFYFIFYSCNFLKVSAQIFHLNIQMWGNVYYHHKFGLIFFSAVGMILLNFSQVLYSASCSMLLFCYDGWFSVLQAQVTYYYLVEGTFSILFMSQRHSMFHLFSGAIWYAVIFRWESDDWNVRLLCLVAHKYS